MQKRHDAQSSMTLHRGKGMALKGLQLLFEANTFGIISSNRKSMKRMLFLFAVGYIKLSVLSLLQKPYPHPRP